MNTEILKPCPFCGAQNVTAYNSPEAAKLLQQQICFVTCRECGAVVSFRGHETPRETREHWNKRSE